MECISTFLNSQIHPRAEEAFMMVTTCPNLAGRVLPGSPDTEALVANCTSPGTELPPVTSADSGIVYQNEYCARCNEAINLVAWQPDLACKPEVYTVKTNMLF
jgi:hypothetical protein